MPQAKWTHTHTHICGTKQSTKINDAAPNVMSVAVYTTDRKGINFVQQLFFAQAFGDKLTLLTIQNSMKIVVNTEKAKD